MKKYYFISDLHFGKDAHMTSVDRESLFIHWLDEVGKDADTIYIVGDLFDYFFEYKNVVPKGFFRTFAKIQELVNCGIKFHFFTGNHDMWIFKYFQEYLGVPIHREPIVVNIGGIIIFVGHGDGLGPDDCGYKIIKKIFANPLCQWIYRWIHPDIGIPLMRFFSNKSREYTDDDSKYTGAEKEFLVRFVEGHHPKNRHIDYYIFGHRHLVIDYKISNSNARYINIGEWLHKYSYAEFDGVSLKIKFFRHEPSTIHS